jgi:hypothetical protein
MRAPHDEMQRALKHHRALAGHHDNLGEEAGKLRDIYRAVTHRLAELGIEDKDVARAMQDFERCARAIRRIHDDAGEVADLAAHHIDRAADSISAEFRPVDEPLH